MSHHRHTISESLAAQGKFCRMKQNSTAWRLRRHWPPEIKGHRYGTVNEIENIRYKIERLFYGLSLRELKWSSKDGVHLARSIPADKSNTIEEPSPENENCIFLHKFFDATFRLGGKPYERSHAWLPHAIDSQSVRKEGNDSIKFSYNLKGDRKKMPHRSYALSSPRHDDRNWRKLWFNAAYEYCRSGTSNARWKGLSAAVV